MYAARTLLSFENILTSRPPLSSFLDRRNSEKFLWNRPTGSPPLVDSVLAGALRCLVWPVTVSILPFVESASALAVVVVPNFLFPYGGLRKPVEGQLCTYSGQALFQ